MTCCYFHLLWDGFWMAIPSLLPGKFHPDAPREASSPHVLQHLTLGAVNSRSVPGSSWPQISPSLGWLNFTESIHILWAEKLSVIAAGAWAWQWVCRREATAPFPCAPTPSPLLLSASFGTCAGENHSQIVTAASKGWKFRLLFSHPSSTPKPWALPRNRVKWRSSKVKVDKPKSSWNF